MNRVIENAAVKQCHYDSFGQIHAELQLRVASAKGVL